MAEFRSGGARRVGRERAVQALFSIENVALSEVPQALAGFWSSVGEEISEETLAFANALIHGVLEFRDSLDLAISEQSANWRLDRMAKVDRNILRVSIFELLHTDTPARVVINEAVEIAKTYGAEGSPAFVNGLLDKIAKAGERLS